MLAALKSELPTVSPFPQAVAFYASVVAEAEGIASKDLGYEEGVGTAATSSGVGRSLTASATGTGMSSIALTAGGTSMASTTMTTTTTGRGSDTASSAVPSSSAGPSSSSSSSSVSTGGAVTLAIGGSHVMVGAFAITVSVISMAML